MLRTGSLRAGAVTTFSQSTLDDFGLDDLLCQ